jgi:hypothetical protein
MLQHNHEYDTIEKTMNILKVSKKSRTSGCFKKIFDMQSWKTKIYPE